MTDFETPAMWYTPNEVTTFKWAGGYIDVGHMHNGEFQAEDCINVYGRSEEMTLSTFQRVCDDYLADDYDDLEDRAS